MYTSRIRAHSLSLAMLLAACGGGGPGAAPDGAAPRPDGVVAGTPGTSSEALVESALAAGKLDLKTATLYRLLAQFAPRRLPAPYQAATALDAFPSPATLRLARTLLADYSPTEAATVKALLASPEDPGWMGFPAELPVRNLGPLDAEACRQTFGASKGQEPVLYLGPPVDASTKHFRFRALLPTSVDVPAQAALRQRIVDGLAAKVPGVGGGAEVTLAQYLDGVYERYANELGKDPSALDRPTANGGRVVVYIAPCEGQANDAFAHPDGWIFATAALALGDAALRRVVLPHELFHIFQYAFDFPPNKANPQHDWPVEATAVGAEDLVAPDVRRWSGKYAASPNLPRGVGYAMDRSFKCPEEPLHSMLSGGCQNRPASCPPGSYCGRYRGDYSKFVLIKFLAGKGTTVWQVWKDYAAKQGDPRTIFQDSDLAEFQAALLADRRGKAPYFTPEERTAFRLAGASSTLDFLHGKIVPRYTYVLDPALLKKLVGFRVTPTDISSLAALDKLDASALPVQPGGTHRWLIEVPKEVTTLQAGGESTRQLDGLIRFSGGTSKASFVLVPLDAESAAADARPGTTYSNASSSFGVGALSTAQPSWTPDDGELPRYFLGLVTNLGDTPLVYRGGLTLIQACRKGCLDFYEADFAQQSCPAKWCTSADGKTPPSAECIAGEQAGLRGLADLIFCHWLCYHFPFGLSAPPSPDAKCGFWTTKTCRASGAPSCESLPMAFIPLPKWPALECGNLKMDGTAPCPSAP